MSANRAASVRARLKQAADTSGQDFNLVLTRFGLERLLYRLSASDHAIKLHLASVKGAAIRKDAGYGGVRVDLKANLDCARISLQVDIGFGDAVTPPTLTVRYPSVLADMPAPTLRAYPKATVIAEKVHAITVLGMANSRMKDYFDLWVLLQDASLDDPQIQQALVATFERRNTPWPTQLPLGLSDMFAGDAAKLKQWQAFLKKNGLAHQTLPAVIDLLRQRLQACGWPSA